MSQNLFISPSSKMGCPCLIKLTSCTNVIKEIFCGGGRVYLTYLQALKSLANPPLQLIKNGARSQIKCCWIGWRFLRYKFYPWITLTIAPLKILAASGINRTHEKIRYMSAILYEGCANGKINFAAVYEFLNELLW